MLPATIISVVLTVEDVAEDACLLSSGLVSSLQLDTLYVPIT